MIVNVPTGVIPVWFINKWMNKEAEPGSPVEFWFNEMLKACKLEEGRQENGQDRNL